MNSWTLNCRSCGKSGRIVSYFHHFSPFGSVFDLPNCLFFFFSQSTLSVHIAKDKACTISSPLILSVSPRIKMSLAVQLWLTPSAPRAAERLPLFDESGPVCFPRSSWCVMHDGAPLQNAAVFRSREAEEVAGEGGGKKKPFSLLFAGSPHKTLVEKNRKRKGKGCLVFVQAEKWLEWPRGEDVMQAGQSTKMALVLHPVATFLCFSYCRWVTLQPKTAWSHPVGLSVIKQHYKWFQVEYGPNKHSSEFVLQDFFVLQRWFSLLS